jgi:hypothetical protein
MSEQKDSKTNVNDFLGELNAGILISQLGLTLSEAALATVLHGKGNKKGKVTLELSFSQIGENDQVVVSTKLSKSVPTQRGKKSEENVTDTPMFVGKGGVLTIDAPKIDDSGQFNLQHQQDNVKIRSIHS